MKLLIVEQDATQLELYTASLEDIFDVVIASSKSDALEKLKEQDIGIVLSEWHFEQGTAAEGTAAEDTAAEFCRFSIDGYANRHPVVIVVSSDGRDNTMRNAFKAGVSHFFVKPYNVIQVTETIINSKHQLETLVQMEKDNQKTRETTKTALSQAAIYGTGMEIVSSLNSCHSTADMAKRVLSTLRLNGVHSALQFRVDNTIESFDTDLNQCDETTLKVFKVLHDQGRIYRFGRRLMLNDTSVSLLVKNIAKDDPVLYDAILDMGAKLVPAINARFENLQQQQTLINLNTNVNEVVDKVHDCIRKVGAEKRQIIHEVSNQIKLSFHELAMTEEQESFFVNLIEKELQSRDDDQELIEVDTMLTQISMKLKAKVAELVVEEAEEEEYLDVEFF